MKEKAIAALVALAIVAGIGLWISSLYVQRNLARADVATEKANAAKQKRRADDFEHSFNDCKSAAAEQSKAVLALAEDKKRLERELADARKAAAAKAKPLYERAEEVAAKKLAAGEDACKWASELIDEQLRLERGK